MEDIKNLLQLHFGYTSLRPGQSEAIKSVLEGKNTLVIMPTGGGKSLCYQLPSLVLKGVTIVISPLIALMKDQVDSLKRVGIPATFINSSISPQEVLNRIEAVKRGEFKLLYIAPERFYNREFSEALKEVEVSLFAIDEAHCISQWGHDFRPGYLRLKEVIKQLGSPTVIALTATATLEVKKDIIAQLDLVNPEVVVTGFARPNLQFVALQASPREKPRVVMEAVSSVPGKSGIIYVGTRARADELLSLLLENNIEASVYHAGMDGEERRWVQENFMAGKFKVIVATNAFGLGIDKRDIRFVIHYDMPGTIEAYYQEAGRAGRDGKPSFCLLLYSPRDKYLQEFFIKGDNPPPEMILELYEALKNYPISSGDISGTILVTHAELARLLSDDVPEMAIGTALKILEREGYIERSRERIGQAFVKIVADQEKIFGSLGSRAKKGKETMERFFSRYGEELRNGWQVNLEEIAEILDTKKDTLVRLLKKLSEENLAEYQPPFKGTEISLLKREDAANVKIDFAALKEKLRKAYSKLDQMEEYIHHYGCRQTYITEYFGERNSSFCKKCDNCLTGFKRRERAAGEDKKEKSYHHKKEFVSRSDAKYLTMETEEDLSQKAKLPTKLTQLETFDLYNKGFTIEQMAVARELKAATIVEHLCFLMKTGLPVHLDKLVNKDKQKKIREAAKKIGFNKLTPLKESLDEEISWEEIKLVLAAEKK